MVEEAVGRRYRYVIGGRNRTDYLHLSSGYKISDRFQVTLFMDVKRTKMVTSSFYDEESDRICLATENSTLLCLL